VPKISNGVAAFNQNANLPAGQTVLPARGHDYNSMDRLLRAYWANQPHTNQYEWDVAAWYGAYMHPGHVSRRQLLAKLFTVMDLAGVMYDNGPRQNHQYAWRDCATQGIPLGAILAHGGRMIIQLPMRTAHDDQATAFFNWLTAEVSVANTLINRTAATHALSHRAPSIAFHGVRRFRIAEERGKLTGLRASMKTKFGNERNHFGVNLPLFGDGRTNWFSGNTVDPNGGHGHLYIYFNPKEVGQCGGIMIGGENSGVGAMSQTFVGHDFLAKSENYSPAGTYKWPAMDHGPRRMTEEFVVDLSDGWTWLQGQEAHFDPTRLDYTPTAVSAAFTQIDPKRIIAYALTDLLDQPGRLGSAAKKRVQAQLDIILNAVNLPRAALQSILRECYAALGTPVVQNAVSGLITPGAPIAVAVPQPMQDVITASTTHWNASA